MMELVEYQNATEMMERLGGSFVKGLARLYEQADERNRERLRVAFADYWQKYQDLYETARAMEAA